MILIDLIKDYVSENVKSIKLKFGGNLFINYYPSEKDDPDTIVSLIDMGGSPPPIYTPVREKKIEFKFRMPTYHDGIKLGNEIFNLFHDKENYYLEDERIMHSYAVTEVSYLYKDQNERKEFSLEVVFLIENNKNKFGKGMIYL